MAAGEQGGVDGGVRCDRSQVIFGVMKVVGSYLGLFYFAASECSFWLGDPD